MAALDFPSSPTNGQTYSANGSTWTYDSTTTSWVAASAGGSSVTVSTTAPSSPKAGDLWWDSTNGTLKVYFTDANTSQWVDAATSGYGGSGSSAGPAFGAYQSSSQSANSANVWTKVQFQTEEFDTANCFDSTTNYRFTPNVAGYYQFNACTQLSNASSLLVISGFYKNGSLFKQSGYQYYSSAISGNATGLSALIYLNGSTDYVEFWYFCDAARTPATGQNCTYFNGFLARTA